jgi:hypothetical protein
MINYGVRSGGGMGDVLPMISYYKDGDYYVRAFFFYVIFHIVIVLVLGNIFLGVIVDTFADLRDQKNDFDDDSKNKCFICNMSRESSTKKFIDFDKHVVNDHTLWNYVSFIVYLYVNNPNDFNELEFKAWNKLRARDISWVPIDDD